MGYRRNQIYKLVFEGDEFEGLEVRVKSLPLGHFTNILSLYEANLKSPGQNDMTKLEPLFSTFVKALVSWNVEDGDGNPVPATREGLDALDLPFILRMILSWIEAVSGVAIPLGIASSPGGPTEREKKQMESSIPMKIA